MPLKVGEIKDKISIAGNGIIALMTAYFLFLRAKKEGKPIKITLRGKYPVDQTTAAFLAPSLSWNEILSVVPPGKKLLESLEKLFTEFTGGIRLEKDNLILIRAKEFIEAVEACSKDENAHQRRTALLVEFSQFSLALWETIFESADNELKQIFINSNFLPCREPTSSATKLRDGYRFDVYYETPDLEKKLQQAVDESKTYGYQHVKMLSPEELLQLDPGFKSFCERHSTPDAGKRKWNNGAGVIFRPGGCIHTPAFLANFAAYLQRQMGTYLNEAGKEKPCFKIKLGEVTGLSFSAKGNRVEAFQVNNKSKSIKRHYEHEHFILSPGENVGTVRRLGLFEPAHARFIGFSLKLIVPEDLVIKAGFSLTYLSNMAIRTGNASSSVVQVGKFNGSFVLRMGGLKAFSGLDQPNLQAEYAIAASIYQLNMLNQVYSSLISACLGRNTQHLQLGKSDLDELLNKKYLERQIGSRACRADGVPTIDIAENHKGPLENVIVATHFSSGGVTNATGGAYLVEQLVQANVTAKNNSKHKLFDSVQTPTEFKAIRHIMRAKL